MLDSGYNYYGRYWDYDHYRWLCTASDTSLANCISQYYSGCNSHIKSIGLVCYSPTQGNRKE